MAKILGLDLGTNSIGWAVVESEDGKLHFPEKNGHPTKGVVIFPEGVNIEAKTGSIKSRAAERTDYRGARRLKFRRKLRKYQTLLVLIKNKMCPLTEDELRLWRNSNFKQYPTNNNFHKWLKTDEELQKNPYYFRFKFADKKYDWANSEEIRLELGRAFYHIAQRRGFKSNRLEQSDENIISDVKDQIQESLSDVNNTAEFYQFIEDLYNEYDLKDKSKDDLDTTQQKIKTTLNYLRKVTSNKIKGKDFSNFPNIKIEIDRYINKPENLGKVKGRIKEISEKIIELEYNTLGQYFWHLYQQDRNKINNKIRTNYTSREEHYLEEFDYICSKQQLGIVNTSYTVKEPANRYEGLTLQLYKAIFYQRPLKSQKGLVGSCTLEPSNTRCPVTRPEFEEFRMWSFVNNIKIKLPDEEQLRSLTHDEKVKILPRFYLTRSTFKLQDIAETLFGKQAVSNEEVYYYKDRKKTGNIKYLINYKLNTTISGNPVSAAFKNIFGENWQTKKYTYRTYNARKQLVEHSVDYKDIWHVLFTFEDDIKLKEYAIKNLGLSINNAKKFSKISMQQGYANLSLKAINKILPWLKKGLIYSHSVFMANIDKVVDEKIWLIPGDRKLIEDTIGEIIESHSLELKKMNAVNALIKTYKNEDAEYSPKAETIFKTDLEKKLQELFGANTWNEKNNREAFLTEAFELLKIHLKKIRSKDAFLKIKRIDDRVIEFLLDHELVSNSKQIEKLYHPSDLEIFKPVQAKDNEGNSINVNGKELKILPLPKTQTIKNPVLMRAMHQLRKLINELLFNGIINDKTRIHIELAREVNDGNKRKAWKLWQDENRNKREEAISEIKALYRAECDKEINPDEDDILRYILWKEQNKHVIYEDECKQISICDIIGPDPLYDIEHTIPRSRSWDNSIMNKTLCSKLYNRAEKKNKIPYELGADKHEEILQRIQHWKERYERLDTEIKNINPSKTDPEKRSNQIVDKNHKTLQRDYWQGKYERFAMKKVPEGFKNSQITDTGLITRFAREYLSCLFRTPSDNSNVRVVNGVAVAEFRRAWGLQEAFQKKSRRNHIHHCQDAIVIACMTKDKYDNFAEEWRKAEEEGKFDVKVKLGKYKPWPTFTQDILKLENELLIVHTHNDNVPKQSKKKERKRGRIQYVLSYETNTSGQFKRNEKGKKVPKKDANGKLIYKLDNEGNRIPLIKQGDTIRGSLHKESFYGAIKDKNGDQIFVIRKKLSDLSDADLEKIIDIKVKEVAINGRKIEKELKKKIEDLKKQFRNAEAEQENLLKDEIAAIQFKIENELYVIPPKKGGIVFTPIRNVRIKAHLAEPLPQFKQHRDIKTKKDGSEKYPHKKWIYVQNDENYCLALYENEERTKRAAEIVKLIDAAEYFNENKEYRHNHPLVPEKKGMMIKGFLKPNTMVLFYEEQPEEIWDIEQAEITRRLYRVRKTKKDGRVTFQFHQEARNDKQIEEDYKNEFDTNAPFWLTDGKAKVDFNELPLPKYVLSPKNMKILIEGIDFKITSTGKILPIKKDERNLKGKKYALDEMLLAKKALAKSNDVPQFDSSNPVEE